MKDSTSIWFKNVSKRFELSVDKPQTVLDQLISTVSRNSSHRRPLWAVHDVSFSVSPGQCMGIVGRNGSGKSTILKLASGILRPTAGTIGVRGRLSALLELGAGFHPELTGHENIYLNGSILGLDREAIDAAYDQIVEFSEIREFLHMPVKHYSSGMYMRLGFSVAAHVQPDILIIDEILAVGDQAFQERCIGRMEELRNQGTTILLVSHTLEPIRALCTEVMWIDKGNFVTVGPTSNIVDQYVASYDDHSAVLSATGQL